MQELITLMHKRLSIKERIIALFLIILFVSYVGNNTFFAHVHYMGNEVITHAHPFTDSHHSHSSNALLTIAFLNHLIFIGTAFSIWVISNKLIRIVYTIVEKKQNSITSRYTSLRAPPVLID